MAVNAASHNAPGINTGAVTEAPPPVSNDVKSQILDAAAQDVKGQSSTAPTGPDGNGQPREKTEKEIAKEKAKAEKLAKLAAKQAKQKQQAEIVATSKKPKPVKKQEEALPPYVEQTPRGEKKILAPLDDAHHTAYHPQVVESAWYDWWEKSGFHLPEFKKDGGVKDKGYFVIPIPPPNVTGALHAGHALATSLQDTLVRWCRMKGMTTLYLPGCDHAGIATQSVVENMLARRRNQTRHDLGRAKFVETCHEWKEDYHQRLNTVLRRMGGSFDWTREAFTMDENLSAAVAETFVRMFDEGYIYRSNKTVNWCTKLNTALSNIEVDQKEIEGRTMLEVPGYDRKIEFGVMTYFKYEIDGTDETITVGTTRPETIPGDTGVCVNPKDERYKHLIGKMAKHPFCDRLLPVFADDHADMTLGTGALKVTPAHDHNDFNLGKRAGLEFINILNDDGTLNENAGKFRGQKRYDARYAITEELRKLGLFVDKKDNPMLIPLCSRSKDVIEPLMRPQWWMKMREMADMGIDAVEKGDIKIRPATAERDYYRWMTNFTDWCLSRQLWWGHQIPAYLVRIDGLPGEDTAEDQIWVCARSEGEAHAKAKPKVEAKHPGKTFTLERDPDCLDTWFSAGLWPFSTLGWPNQTHDLEKLYPTSVLETGWDILPFWVCRMIMFGLKLTGKVPFKEVYCHSLIRDSDGRKMSKSLGNVIDPVDIMDGITLERLHEKLLMGNLHPNEVEKATRYQKTTFPKGIPDCGADALRFSLVQYTTGGGDINFDVSVMHGYRKFCNKIYQATKYVLMNLPGDFVPQAKGGKTGRESLAERWILHKMNAAVQDVNQQLEDREFSRSTSTVHRYWLENLCDVYIENSKAIIAGGNESEKRSAVDTLYTALETGLRIMHPFMPFLTEELWQRLPRRPGDATKSIVIADYPEFDSGLVDARSDEAYELVLQSAGSLRELTSGYKINENGKAVIRCTSADAYSTASAEQVAIRSLTGRALSSLRILGPDSAAPRGCAVSAISADAVAYIEIEGHVDTEEAIKNTRKRLDRARETSVKQKKVLGVDGFESKVSFSVLEEERKKLATAEAEIRNYEESLRQLEEMKL